MSDRKAAFSLKDTLRTIRIAGEQRGVVLMLRGQIVQDLDDRPPPDGAALVTTLGAAFAATDGNAPRHAHVIQLVEAIALNARDRSGVVMVNRTSLLLLRSYAETGGPPKREEEQERAAVPSQAREPARFRTNRGAL